MRARIAAVAPRRQRSTTSRSSSLSEESSRASAENIGARRWKTSTRPDSVSPAAGSPAADPVEVGAR